MVKEIPNNPPQKEKENQQVSTIIVITIMAVIIIIMGGVLVENAINKDINQVVPVGCVSRRWLNPNGQPEIFADGEISPDGQWICLESAGSFEWERYQEVDLVEEIPCTPVPCEPVPCTPVPEEDLCANRETPVLYEGEFPGTVEGPAIIEWWDGGPNTKEHEGIFFLNEGETFKWDFRGHYWVFCSQTAGEKRYEIHKLEFFDKWPMDEEGRPSTQ